MPCASQTRLLRSSRLPVVLPAIALLVLGSGAAVAQVNGVVEADVSVREDRPDKNYGGEGELQVQRRRNKARRTFLRLRVSGVGTRPVERAVVQLLVATAEATSRVQLRRISSCGWSESAVTWRNQPPVDGALLDEVDRVAEDKRHHFDVTGAVTSDGTYCFALDTSSAQEVKYYSRTALADRRPRVEIVLKSSPPVCGDGVVNQGSEACDGGDAAACPGACRADCTCPPLPACGDGTVNQGHEQCDGGDAAACPGACRADCTCPPPPACGDGTVNQGHEQCDGGDAAACPGACRADCTCPPPPACGDGTMNQGHEQCDGGDAAACPGACRADCTCPPPPACGDGTVNQGHEQCDGGGDAACPGACRADCTCPPLPACGDGTMNQGHEQCDGGDAAACPGACRADCTCPPPPACGDGTMNQGHEQCDGGDAAACPGACRADCTCPPLPACGDGAVNQGHEQCDGGDAAACPGACRADCTCPPPPACGDGTMNQGHEQCDGGDAAACPGACRADCACPPPPVSATVEADVSAREKEGTQNFGAAPLLSVDLDSAKQSFLRVRVTGVSGRQVARALLHLQVAALAGSESDSGGRLHTITGCDWNEMQVVWGTRPAIDGRLLGAVGPVARGAVVTFDLTEVLTGDGAYCFALDSLSADGVEYVSREGATGQPRIELTAVTPMPAVCGDGVVNQAGEQCDGADAAACPGACRADCACPPPPPSATVEADVSAREKEGTQNFGAAPLLSVDLDSAKQSFLRVRVTGVGGRQVARALLHLQVAALAGSESDSGGRLHTITGCDWNEMQVVWGTRPAIDGRLLGAVGPVARGAVVTFDLTEVLTGDGAYCFALDSLSADGVEYVSREGATGQPRIELTAVTPMGAVCGDDVVDPRTEECDGPDAALCPGQCRSDCTCAAVCGDGNLNQAGEACDGFDDQACPGRCRADCTCPLPVCGDGHVNQASEECDGDDVMACPEACRSDCTCATALPVGVVEADVPVRLEMPSTNYGASRLLWVDASPVNRVFLRARVRGVGARPVLGARLRLVVANEPEAGSTSGGRISRVSNCAWQEGTLTWETQPAIDGGVLDQAGAAPGGRAVEFDVGGAIRGDGVYCFALDGVDPDGAIYRSREATAGRPALEIVVAGTCGDGVINQMGEQCDGFNDADCPAGCFDDCTCSMCGDGLAEAPLETCDGFDDAACAGACGGACTCPDLPASPFACLRQPGPAVALTGTYLDGYRNDTLAPATKIDARAATFVAWPGREHPLNLSGAAGVCVAGGTVRGQFDRSWSWDQMHAFNEAGIAFTNAQSTVDGVRIDNMPDGIRPRAGSDFTIRNAWLSYIRDDCVENDRLVGGLVDDSLFDGCYVAFSARPSPAALEGGVDGSAKVWTIRNSLVRLEPMPGPREGGGSEGIGHGGFFKWHSWNDSTASLSPKLALYDNVFMAEEVGVVGGDRMGIPPGQVLDCANNVLVWLGAGSFPGTVPSCVRITTDRAVWDAAVADWKRRHPGMDR